MWEAIADPATAGLGDVMWIVDFNRQSLDRVIPGMRIEQWTRAVRRSRVACGRGQVRAAGCGRPSTQPGGAALRALARRRCPTSSTSRSSGCPRPDRASPVPRRGPRPRSSRYVAEYDDDDAASRSSPTSAAMTWLRCWTPSPSATRRPSRPSVVFAYTVKGFGLPIAGHPRNHSALLTTGQVDALRASMGLTRDDRVGRVRLGGSEGDLARRARPSPAQAHARTSLTCRCPIRRRDLQVHWLGRSTQESFGRVISDLARDEGLRPLPRDDGTRCRHVDESRRASSTGSACTPPRSIAPWSADPVLTWAEGPTGQHLELGISEMNLFMMLGALGRSGELNDQPLLPHRHGLRPVRPAWTRCLRARGLLRRPVHRGRHAVGRDAGSRGRRPPVDASRASVGHRAAGRRDARAGVRCWPWTGCCAMRLLTSPARAPRPTPGPPRDRDGAYYFRLSTRSIDQAPFDAARDVSATPCCDARCSRAPTGSSTGASTWASAYGDDGGDGHSVVHLRGCGCRAPRGPCRGRVSSRRKASSRTWSTSRRRDASSAAWQRTIRQAVRTATTPSLPGDSPRRAAGAGADRDRPRCVVTRARVGGIGGRHAPGLPGR